MPLGQRTRVTLIGVLSILVALTAIAFAVGGAEKNSASAMTTSARGAAATPAGVLPKQPAQDRVPGAVPSVAPGLPARADGAVENRELSAASTGAAGAGGSSAADSARLTRSSSSLGASRIVKTGNLTIRVAKGRVQSVTQALTALATSQGGYVAESNSSLDTTSPYGEVVLRIPVAHFEAAISAAEKLGEKVVSLNTSADDVTGKYVDLSAKKRALERTRQTYLAILSRARTIGATLAVQQRIDDVQQQIDQLHGQIKLLGNQSSYSTLTVDVVPSGGVLPLAHHARHGIGKAWHDSWSRFGRGVNAIVGAIGPIVFALLLLAVIGLIGFAGYRGVRRAIRGTPTAA